jgi:cell pole-organizing protein PopZ
MEEILASIRRIIADDDTVKSETIPTDTPRPRAAVPPASPPEQVMHPERIDATLAEQDAWSATPTPVEKPSSAVLDLTDAMTVPATGRADRFRTIVGESDIGFEDGPKERVSQASARAPEPPPPMEQPQRQNPAADERALVSTITSAAVDSAFNTLAQTVLVQNARTLEDLVREMLRPLLKTWLDDNLPGVVERLVRAEIERVSRGRS